MMQTEGRERSPVTKSRHDDGLIRHETRRWWESWWWWWWLLSIIRLPLTKAEEEDSINTGIMMIFFHSCSYVTLAWLNILLIQTRFHSLIFMFTRLLSLFLSWWSPERNPGIAIKATQSGKTNYQWSWQIIRRWVPFYHLNPDRPVTDPNAWFR